MNYQIISVYIGRFMKKQLSSKTLYRLLGVLMLCMITQAMTCDGYDDDLMNYTMSKDNVPQVPYLTTISSDYFKEIVVQHGWKWKESWLIGADGIGKRVVVSSESDFVPNDLFFGTDSITVFMYKRNSNERQSESYTYDASNNLIVNNMAKYMQLVHADSLHISFIERRGNNYFESKYERMLPYELNARWLGFTPKQP